MHEDILQNIDLILEERLLENPYPLLNPSKVLDAYNKYELDDLDDLNDVPIKKLEELKSFHKSQKKLIPMDAIMKERLLKVLLKSEIFNPLDEPKNVTLEKNIIEQYEKALSISSKGYTVWLKRDVDEININGYNPEWIKCWNGNMDIQPCFDYFGIITSVSYTHLRAHET